jgi:hypothetical protein
MAHLVWLGSASTVGGGAGPSSSSTCAKTNAAHAASRAFSGVHKGWGLHQLQVAGQDLTCVVTRQNIETAAPKGGEWGQLGS